MNKQSTRATTKVQVNYTRQFNVWFDQPIEFAVDRKKVTNGKVMGFRYYDDRDTQEPPRNPDGNGAKPVVMMYNLNGEPSTHAAPWEEPREIIRQWCLDNPDWWKTNLLQGRSVCQTCQDSGWKSIINEAEPNQRLIDLICPDCNGVSQGMQ